MAMATLMAAKRPTHGMDVDAHIWLSTANARAMVLAMANTLATADPVNGERYRRNAEIADRRLAALRDDIARTLEPVRARPYIVFHDAYQYFEREFGTTVLGAVTLSPERPPGARTLMQVRDRLVAGQAACVFAEPQFRPQVIEAVSQGTGARVGTLDPQGLSLRPGADAYFKLMRGIADALAACLAPATH